MNHFILIVILASIPLTAAAQVRDARSLLNGPMQALGQAGFAGMQDIPMPQAPSAAPGSPVAPPVDETTQAVAALVEAVQKTGTEGSLFGAILKKVGLAFEGETFPFKVFQMTDAGTLRRFTVTSVRGKNDILLETMKKVGGKKQLWSYLISDDGRLLGAAVSWKENGTYLAESVPLAEAEVGYREQLDFWLRYYRANLKKS